jgi:hypothetical protein
MKVAPSLSRTHRVRAALTSGALAAFLLAPAPLGAQWLDYPTAGAPKKATSRRIEARCVLRS